MIIGGMDSMFSICSDWEEINGVAGFVVRGCTPAPLTPSPKACSIIVVLEQVHPLPFNQAQDREMASLKQRERALGH
jgi:hypothetical protein